jgi:hypothetical protein
LERGDRAQRSRWAFFNSLFTFAVFTEAVSLMPADRLARGLEANLALEMLRFPTQVRKNTAVRREFVVKAVKMGHRPSAVAAFLRCTPSAISKIVARSL